MSSGVAKGAVPVFCPSLYFANDVHTALAEFLQPGRVCLSFDWRRKLVELVGIEDTSLQTNLIAPSLDRTFGSLNSAFQLLQFGKSFAVLCLQRTVYK